MDQCDGQMDVFEVLDLVEREGLIPVREETHLIVDFNYRTFPLGKIQSGDFVDFSEISAKPMWNRGPSPVSE